MAVYVYTVRLKAVDSDNRMTVVLNVDNRLNTADGKKDFHVKLKDAVKTIKESKPGMQNLFVERCSGLIQQDTFLREY